MIGHSVAMAQTAPSLSWASNFSRGDYSTNSVATDSLGNVYVTGSSFGFDGSNYDFVTLKYDSAGNQQWIVRYDGGGRDYAVGIAVDPSGNAYVTGTTADANGTYFTTIKYDTHGNQLWLVKLGGAEMYNSSGSIVLDTLGNVYVSGTGFNGANGEYETIKYDSNGNQLWVAVYDTGVEDAPRGGLVVDSSGNVYVTGYSYNMSQATSEIATIKYDSNGTQLWVTHYGGGNFNNQWPTGIALDPAGNVYVTGGSCCTNSSFITLKYDSSGNRQWDALFNSGLTSGGASGIAVDATGNVFVTGQIANGVSTDFATIRYDTNGNQIWVARYDNGGYDHGDAIALDRSGNIYVTGYSANCVDMTGEVATLKYDIKGNQLWAARFSSSGISLYPSALSVDSSLNIYVTGRSGNFNLLTFKYSQSYVDLVETNVTSPAIGTQQNPGSNMTVTDTVANQGGAASSSFNVGFFLSPAGPGRTVFLGSRFVSAVASGSSSSATTTLKLPTNMPGGTYFIQAIADYATQVDESDETNNSLTNTTGVISIPPGDLVMTSVTTTATSVIKGGSASVSYTVKNQGNNATSMFYIGFYLSTDNIISTTDKLLGTVYIKNGLAAGASYSGTISLIIPKTTATGNYYLGAYADYANQVSESNESNNGLPTAGTIQVR